MTQILIDIANSTMRVYQAAAEERGFHDGQALIAALLADWPAILAPAVQPGPSAFYTPEPLGAAIESGAFLASLDFPSGAAY